MRAKPLNIFIGFDSSETVAYHVCVQSIIEQASVPVYISPVIARQLPLKREPDPLASTEFTYSRFLVPWLMNYHGKALFMDCDMLVDCDIKEVFDAHEHGNCVSVVQHDDYTPATETKFLNQEQTTYPRKNWSSLMLFDCGHVDCLNLTPDSVSHQSGKYLHRFEWTDEIGELDPTYNHLVGEYEDKQAKIYHYTLGTPCFAETSHCDKSREWHRIRREMNDCAD